MFRIFDYIYFRTYSIYKNKWNEKLPGLYAVSLVSVLQSCNLLTIPFLYELFSGVKLSDIGIEGYHYFGTTLFIIILNSWRYNYFARFEKLYRIWEMEELNLKRKRGYIILIYLILTLIIFIGLAIILGEINQGR